MDRWDNYSNGWSDELYHYGVKGMKWGEHLKRRIGAAYDNIEGRIMRYNAKPSNYGENTSAEKISELRKANIKSANDALNTYNNKGAYATGSRMADEVRGLERRTKENARTLNYVDALRRNQAKLDAKDDNEWNYFKKSKRGQQRTRNRWQNAVGRTMDTYGRIGRGIGSNIKKTIGNYSNYFNKGVNEVKERVRKRFGR